MLPMSVIQNSNVFQKQAYTHLTSQISKNYTGTNQINLGRTSVKTLRLESLMTKNLKLTLNLYQKFKNKISLIFM